MKKNLNLDHFSPLLELAYHPEDFNISPGVHFGLGF